MLKIFWNRWSGSSLFWKKYRKRRWRGIDLIDKFFIQLEDIEKEVKGEESLYDLIKKGPDGYLEIKSEMLNNGK